jgi:hypothetical protein
VLEHPLDGVVVLRVWGGCTRAAKVGSIKERGRGGVAVTDTLYRRRGGEWGTARERHHVVARGGGGAWGQRGGRVAWRGMAASGPVAAFMGSPCASETGEGGG